jgi:hypothetical protein
MGIIYPDGILIDLKIHEHGPVIFLFFKYPALIDDGIFAEYRYAIRSSPGVSIYGKEGVFVFSFFADNFDGVSGWSGIILIKFLKTFNVRGIILDPLDENARL